MKRSRRHFLHLAAETFAVPIAARTAVALNYPARPVRIIVGYPAGSGPDLVARLLGQRLSERFGQQFVVEDRPGAASNIATEVVVRGSPDGYTLLMATSTNAINTALYDKLNFDFMRDIVPVASIGRAPVVVVVNPSFPARTLPEFIDYARANAGKINFVSSGIGTLPHVAGELFSMSIGVKLVHVSYRSSYMPDLLSGQVQVVFTTIPTVIEYIRTARLRALAVGSATRSDLLPDIPTVSDFVPGYEASGWYGICVARGSPTEIIEKLHKEISAVVDDADMKTHLVDLGAEPMLMTSDEFGEFIVHETAKWAKVIKFDGIKPD